MRVKSRYPESIEYHATTDWDGKTGAIAHTEDGRTIVLDTPKVYGGRGEGICPDELFVSALLGCLNNTFLDFQRRFELDLISFHLDGKASAKFDGQGYRITGVKVTGDVIVGKDEIEVGERCVELMKEYCHISRTIENCIPFEYNITVRESNSQ